jgi:hypothetical protein
MRFARGAVASLCVLTLLLIGATWFAFVQRSEAIRQRNQVVLAILDTQGAYSKLSKVYDELSAVYKEKHDEAIKGTQNSMICAGVRPPEPRYEIWVPFLESAGLAYDQGPAPIVIQKARY